MALTYVSSTRQAPLNQKFMPQIYFTILLNVKLILVSNSPCWTADRGCHVV